MRNKIAFLKISAIALAICALSSCSDGKIHVKFDLNTNLETIDIVEQVFPAGEEVMIEEPTVVVTGDNPENYDVSGWYTEKTYERKWDFYEDTTSKSMTLFAKWERKFTITYYQAVEGQAPTKIWDQKIYEGRKLKKREELQDCYKDLGAFRNCTDDGVFSDPIDFDSEEGITVNSNMNIYFKKSENLFFNAGAIKRRFTAMPAGGGLDGSTTGNISIEDEKDAEGNVIGQYARVYFGRAVSVCDPYILLTNPALDVSKSQAIKITMRNLGPANKLSFYWVGKWKDGTWIDGKENVSFNEEHAYHFTSGYKKNQSETSTWTTYTIPVCESLYNGVSTWGAAGKITALRIQSTASDDKTTEKNILQIKSIEGISRPEYSTEDDTTDIKNKCKNDSQSEIDQAIEEQKNNPINGFIFPRDNDEISSEDLNKEDGKNLKLFKHKDGTLFSTARTNGAYTFSLTPKQGHDVKLSENNQYFTNLNINYINYSYVKEMNLTVKYSLNGQTRDYITSVPLTPQMDGTSAQTANINLFQKGFDGELVSLTFRIIPIGNDNLIEFKQISFDVYQPNIIPGIDFVDILCGSFDQKNNVETSFDFQQFKTKVHVTSSNEPYMSKNIPSYDLLGYESFTLNYDYKGESTNGKIKLKFGLEDSSSKEFEIGINKGANSTTQAFAWSGCSVIKSIKLEYLGIEEIYLEKLTYNLPISSINLSNKGYVSSVKGRNTNFDFDANHSAYKRTLPELARLRFYGFDKAKSDGHIIDNLSLKGKHSLVITYSCEIPFTSESDSKIFTFLYGGTSTDDPNYKNSANEPGGIIPGTGRSGSLDSPSPFKPKSYAGMEPNSWATFKIDFNEALTGEELECFITVWAFEFNTKKEGNFYVRAMSII